MKDGIAALVVRTRDVLKGHAADKKEKEWNRRLERKVSTFSERSLIDEVCRHLAAAKCQRNDDCF